MRRRRPFGLGLLLRSTLVAGDGRLEFAVGARPRSSGGDAVHEIAAGVGWAGGGGGRDVLFVVVVGQRFVLFMVFMVFMLVVVFVTFMRFTVAQLVRVAAVLVALALARRGRRRRAAAVEVLAQLVLALLLQPFALAAAARLLRKENGQ